MVETWPRIGLRAGSPTNYEVGNRKITVLQELESDSASPHLLETFAASHWLWTLGIDSESAHQLVLCWALTFRVAGCWILQHCAGASQQPWGHRLFLPPLRPYALHVLPFVCCLFPSSLLFFVPQNRAPFSIIQFKLIRTAQNKNGEMVLRGDLILKLRDATRDERFEYTSRPLQDKNHARLVCDLSSPHMHGQFAM